MTTEFAIGLVDEVNAYLDAQGVLDAIDFHADKVQHAGETIKAFCPVHKDSRFRSVLVDSERKAFRCTVKTCAGFGGGSLVDLYALSCEMSPLQAATDLAQKLKVPLQEGWLAALTASYKEEASAARDRGDYTEAQTLLRELIAVAPQMVEPRMMLASLLDELGNSQEAAEEFVRIIDESLTHDRTDDAVMLVDEALQRFPQNEDVRFASVRVAESVGSKDLAIMRMQEIIEIREAENRQMDNIGLLEQLVEKAPDRPEFAIKLGGLYEQQHNVRAASRQYEEAAKYYEKIGDNTAAVQWLEKVVQFNSENNRARLQLAQLLLQLNDKDKAREHTFRVINQHIDQQEFGPAVNTVNGWLEHEPGNIQARELLARIFLEQDRTPEAAAYLMEGARIAAEADDHNTAADLLLRAKYLTPDSVDLRRELIQEFTALGEHQRAAFERIDLAEILFATEPEAATDLLAGALGTDISLNLKLQMLGALVNHKQFDIAHAQVEVLQPEAENASPDIRAEFFELRSRLNPTNLQIHLALFDALWHVSPGRAVDAAADSAEILLKNNQQDDAVSVVEAATSRLEDYVSEAMRLMVVAAQTGRTDLAGVIYQTMVQGLAEEDPQRALDTARWMWEADPHHPSAASDIAYLLAAAGRTEEAAAQYALVAEMLRNAGEFETALQYAREAVGLDPASLPALASQARLAGHLLPADEAEAVAQSLLQALPGAQTAEAAAAGYLAATEIFPEDDALLRQAEKTLTEFGDTESAARIQARQAALLGGRGDWNQATRILAAAVESAPVIPEIWEQYGEATKITGEAEVAAQAFAEATLAYQALGLSEDAERTLNSAQLMEPKTPASWEKAFSAADAINSHVMAAHFASLLARHYAQEGPPAITVRWAREWMRLAQDNPYAHSALASALAAIDQIEAASQSFMRAAHLYYEQGDLAGAANALELPIRAGDTSDTAIDLLEALAANTSLSPDTSAKVILLQGIAALNRSDLQGAWAAAEKAPPHIEQQLWPSIARMANNPVEAADAWLRAGTAFRATKNIAGATGHLREAIDSGHSTLAIHGLLAEILSESGAQEEALPHQLQVIRRAAESDPPFVDKYLAQLRKTYTHNIDALVQLAQVLLEINRRELALTDLEAAANLALASNNTTALINICGMDEELTRKSTILTRARADALMGAENEQQALEWVADSARQLAAEEKFEEAREMAERWLNLRPRDVEARNLFALACEKTGRQKEADATNLRTAEILLNAGDSAGASKLLEQILTRETGNTQAMRLLIEAQKRSADIEGATRSICRLAELLENNGEIEAALSTYAQCVALDQNAAHALWRQAELTRVVEDDRAALPLYRRWLQARKTSVDDAQYINDLHAVVEIMPQSSGILRELSDALINAGRGSEAVSFLERLKITLEAEGDFIGAANALEAITAQNATPIPEQHLQAAQLYEKGSAPSMAQDHLRQAADLFDKNSRFGDAAAALDKVIQLGGESAMPEDYALAAAAHAKGGNQARASALIKSALQILGPQTGNRDRKEKILAQALEIAPLDPDYVIQHMEYLPSGRAMAEGLRASKAMSDAGQHDDAISVMTQVIALAPHDMSLRQQLFEPLRASGNKVRLRQELMLLASDALAAGDNDAAYEALDEAEQLATTAQQHRALAELNERARRLDQAVSQFMEAAVRFADAGKNEQAIASINRAMSARPAAVSAEVMADMVGKIGEPIYNIAREQLRTTLSARRQKQSQILALALMNSSPGRATDVLKTVYTLGGSSILAGISNIRVQALLESNDIPNAIQLVNDLLEIAPDSSDIWHLFAQVSNAAGNKPDAVRAALEAARLYAMAGAVMEEEDSYNEALEADPTDNLVRASYADFLIREHRPDEAVAQFQAIVEQAELSGDVDTQIEALNRAIQVAPANLDLREKLATLLEKIAPDSAIENWLYAAAAYRDENEIERARRTWQHVLSLNSRNETALNQLMLLAREDADLMLAGKLANRLAELKAARRNIGEACRILQAHLEIDPDNLEILEQLSAMAGASNDNEVFTTTTRALARKFQKKGDNESALRHYEALLDRNPRDGALLTTILDCCAAAGQSEKGISYARQLLNIARETEDPERIRVAAATIINFDETDADVRRELAESLLSLNRVPEAVTEFLRAAEFYEGAGSNANAFTCYRRATQISPGSMQAWRRLADLALTIGDIETARRSVAHVMETASKADVGRIKPLLDRVLQSTAEAHDVHEAAFAFYRRIDDRENAAAEAVWLGNHAAETGAYEEAESFFTEALKLDPGNNNIKTAHYAFIRQVGRTEELQLRLRQEADEHLANGNTAAAIDIFKELAAVTPGQIGVHRDLARLLESAERHDEALEQYLQVITLLLDRSELEDARDTAESVVARFPESANARELVADVLAGSAYPDLAARYYSTAAESALLAKDEKRAIHLLKKAVKARPLWAGARTALINVYEKTGDKQLAFEASIELVTVLLESGEFLEATATLNKLSAANPDSPEVREQLAGLYEKTGRKDDYIRVLRELSQIYEKAGNNVQAAAAYHRLSQADPEDATAMARYVELATSLGDTSENFADEYSRLADVLARSGDVDGAFQAYEQVLAQAPDNTSVRSRYATFLLARGSRNRALTEMRTLANLYIQRGEPAAAAEVLNAALTISPRDAELCLELAKAQESAGMIEDARVSYSRASAILANTAAVKGIDTYRRILSMDEGNTAVRLRLVELLIKTGDTMEAAREARILAEIHINRGELAEAEHAYGLIDQCEPQSLAEIREAIQRDSYDPSLQYLHYVRLGNCLFNLGDIDAALDAYRTARSLHDDQVDLIQKCIDCVALIAPEAEAIPDYLQMAEKHMLAGDLHLARKAYDKVRMIDPFNNDARCGLESVASAESRQTSATSSSQQDDLVLKTSRSVNKRVALMDLLVACQEAADNPTDNDSARLGLGKK